MSRLLLAAGVAALAITAPAMAKPDHARGGEHQTKQAKAERGGGQRAQRTERRQAQRANVQRTERRQASRETRAVRADRTERRNTQRFASMQSDRRGNGDRKAERQAQRVERHDRQVQRSVDRSNRVERQAARQDRQVREMRDDRRAIRNARVEDRFDRRIEMRNDRIANRAQIREARADRERFVGTFGRSVGFVDGCPRGLAKKNNGCLPPGQAKKLVGQVIPAAYRERVLPDRLRYIYPDTDDYYYRYGDGYLYRVNRTNNLVNSLVPLLGAGLLVGDPFPNYYMNSYVPPYYSAFYPDTPYSTYRYANGYVYEIDPFTGMVEDIDPAYGYGYGVGQMWPSSYGYYNVPLAYRDMYYDTSDYYYRYAPGAIYQIDPTTSLITAVVSLLSGGMSVGQPLPMGYDVYNVPYAYRSQYYDTPNAWYRYSNGYIYQVDPTTRLITAAIDAIV